MHAYLSQFYGFLNVTTLQPPFAVQILTLLLRNTENCPTKNYSSATYRANQMEDHKTELY